MSGQAKLYVNSAEGQSLTLRIDKSPNRSSVTLRRSRGWRGRSSHAKCRNTRAVAKTLALTRPVVAIYYVTNK